MKRFTAASFLLVTILTASMLLQGQTRPRRVGPAPDPEPERVASDSVSGTPVEQPIEQPVEQPVERPVERPANHRWRNIFLGAGTAIAIGAAAGGHGACSPSRDVLIRRPRL